MRIIYTFIICAVFIVSCNDTTQTTAPQVPAPADGDSINYALNPDSVKMMLNNITPPEGFYQVTLPCTNCKGIEHTVLFNRDLSYRIEEKIIGEKGLHKAVVGNWKPVEGSIWLYKDSSVVARYTWHGDTLQYIDLNSGVHIPLRALPAATAQAVWKERRDDGFNFFGTGTEPFWSVSVHPRKGIEFRLAGWNEGQRFKSVTPAIATDSTVYVARNDSAVVRVTIYNRFCSDGMSDFIYPREVHVLYKNQTYRGCGAVVQ